MYKNYLVILINKGNYTSYYYDLDILKIIGFNNKLEILDQYKINHIIVNNLEIIIKKKFLDNRYDYYFKFCILKKVILFIESNTKLIK